MQYDEKNPTTTIKATKKQLNIATMTIGVRFQSGSSSLSPSALSISSSSSSTSSSYRVYRDDGDGGKRQGFIEGGFGHLLQVVGGFARLLDELLQDRLFLAEQKMRFVELGHDSRVQHEDPVRVHHLPDNE